MASDQLQPQLEAAQKTLEVALDEACGVDLRDVDTGEMIRIEETLAIASEAAKQAVSVRLRMRNKRRSQPGVDAPAPQATDRVFDDFQGRRWHAYEVHPSAATLAAGGLPEAYEAGWLAFESRDEKRRVVPIPENWFDRSTDELRELCHTAAAVPRRPGASS